MPGCTLEQGHLLRERYRITGVIGKGAHGVVYSADDLAVPGARWAVKEICEGAFAEDERHEILGHFVRERRLLQDLNHPGVPRARAPAGKGAGAGPFKETFHYAGSARGTARDH